MSNFPKLTITLFVLTTLILVYSSCSSSSSWEMVYSGSYKEKAWSIQSTSDGGYIIVGDAWRFYGDGVDYDAYLLKINAQGKKEWSRTYTVDELHRYDIPVCLKQISDGGYILTIREWYDERYYELILDSHGVESTRRLITPKNTIWKYTADCCSARDEVSITPDGGCYWLDFSSGPVRLQKISPSYELEWEKTILTLETETALSLSLTSDSGFVVTGYIGGNDRDFLLIKFDSHGNEQWRRTYDAGKGEQASSVRQTSDGGYIIVGTTGNIEIKGYTESHQETDILLIKTDTNGQEEWRRLLGGEGFDKPQAIEETSDHGYIIVGSRTHRNMDEDVYVIKISPNSI